MNTLTCLRVGPAAAELVRICAWCQPGVGGENVTHTICERHLALELANVAKLAAWQDEPAVIVRRHPTGGWSHAVKQPRPGDRIYRGWWASAQAAAEALSPHVARTGAAVAAA